MADLFIHFLIDMKKSAKEACGIREVNGFLQTVCFYDQHLGFAIYKCPYSEVRYLSVDKLSFRKYGTFNATCPNDTRLYQVTGT